MDKGPSSRGGGPRLILNFYPSIQLYPASWKEEYQNMSSSVRSCSLSLMLISWVMRLDLQRGQVVWWWSNHLSRQGVWKKWEQGSCLISCPSSKLDKQTAHSTWPSSSWFSSWLTNSSYWNLLLGRLFLISSAMTWTSGVCAEAIISKGVFGFSCGYDPFWSMNSGSEWGLMPTIWRMDLKISFRMLNDRAVFTIRIGKTPSDTVVGKLERPIKII